MKMDAQINFRTSSEVKEQVEEIAKVRGVKPSQLINEIVADFLQGRGGQKSPDINIEKLHKIVASHEKQLEVYGKQIEKLHKIVASHEKQLEVYGKQIEMLTKN